jgi:hypothetical protein
MIAEKVYGYLAKPTLRVLGHLISIIMDDKTRGEESVALLLRAFEGYSKTFGSEDDETIRIMFQLITVLVSTGSDQVETFALEYFQTVRNLRGNSHADTVKAAMTVASIRERRYSKLRIQDPSKSSQEAQRAIAEIMSLHDQCPHIWGELSFFLGKMLLWRGDELNAQLAFGLALSQQLTGRLCDGCNESLGGAVKLKGICSVCEDVYLCRSCYLAFVEAPHQVTFVKECTYHSFSEIEVGNDREVDKDVWIASLLARDNGDYFGELEAPTGSRGRCTYLGEDPGANYTFTLPRRIVQIPSSKKDWERDPIELDISERFMQEMRKCQIRDWVPRMLFNWFSLGTEAPLGRDTQVLH